MSKTLKIRDVVLGEGSPKIIVPIVSKTCEGIIESAKSFLGVKLDIVEWRVDHYDDVFDFEKVASTAKLLRETLPDTPILFTFRTSKEGGEKAIDSEVYATLNKDIAKTGLVDLIDVEAFTGDDIVRDIIECAHQYDVKVVASNHDFDKTPEKDDIVSRLRKMQDLGADIPKIAVMPRSRRDVITLLTATEEMYTEYADRPIITMSMAGQGLVSRLVGEAFGSSATFGAVGKVSAPGQMNATDLDTVLSLIHGAMM